VSFPTRPSACFVAGGAVALEVALAIMAFAVAMAEEDGCQFPSRSDVVAYRFHAGFRVTHKIVAALIAKEKAYEGMIDAPLTSGGS